MTKAEENINSMFGSVISVLSSNQSKVDTLPALSNSFVKFENSVTALRAKDAEYKHLTAGKTQMKNDAEEEMIEGLLPIASAMNVYAKVNGITDLKENSKVTTSDLRRMRDTDLHNRVQYLHDTGIEHAAQLADYGVTADKLTALQILIDNYANSMDVKETSYAERSAAREALTNLFDETNDILKEEVDPLMEIFRPDDPDFYNEYQSARVIRDLGLRHDPVEPTEP